MSENSVRYVLNRIHHVMNNVEFPSFNLKAKQVICLEYLLKKRDVIGVFPTGYGKSFIFHVLPDLFPQKVPGLNNIVIVVCPLNSIVKDQIDVTMFYYPEEFQLRYCGLAKIIIWTDILLVCSILKMSS